jgi:hypothetical protein
MIVLMVVLLGERRVMGKKREERGMREYFLTDEWY